MKIEILQSSKSFICLSSFVIYCNTHPELRFWQALLNWSGQKFILFSESSQSCEEGFTDPYYFEEKNK
jgi:hypothetical protein